MLHATYLPPLGKVKEGDRLIVVYPAGRYTARVEIDVRVTKVARVWIEMERAEASAEFPRGPWRMRLDDQTNGSDFDARRILFRTRGQLDFEQAAEQADTAIRDFGLVFRAGRWSPAQRIRLAELLREHAAELRPASEED